MRESAPCRASSSQQRSSSAWPSALLRVAELRSPSGSDGSTTAYISEQLGHASVQITLDRYGHLFDQSYADESAKLEKALSTPSRLQALQAHCKHRPSKSLPQRSMATASLSRKSLQRSRISGRTRNAMAAQARLLTGGLLVRVQPGELLSACKATRYDDP